MKRIEIRNIYMRDFIKIPKDFFKKLKLDIKVKVTGIPMHSGDNPDKCPRCQYELKNAK